jgi:hypothetical protein
MQGEHGRYRRLRWALLANAALSGVFGALLLLDAGSCAGSLGGLNDHMYRALGGTLVGFALVVALTGARSRPDSRAALAISVADLGWIVVTASLPLFLTFTRLGILAIVAVDGAVLGLALSQLSGIERAFRVHLDHAGSHRVCVEVASPTPADELWKVVAKLEDIVRYAPNLRYSRVRRDRPSGAGAVRECGDLAGRCWAERCTRWDPELRSLEVEFLTEEPSFPFPFRTMRGGWDVAEHGAGSQVRVWWEMSPRKRWATPFLLPLMAAEVRRMFPAVVCAMTASLDPGYEAVAPSRRLAGGAVC